MNFRSAERRGSDNNRLFKTLCLDSPLRIVILDGNLEQIKEDGLQLLDMLA